MHRGEGRWAGLKPAHLVTRVLALARGRGGRGGRRLEAGLDLGELLVRALPNRALEPLAGAQHVPASEEQERREDRERRVVEEVPVEVRLERNASLVGGEQENEADAEDPDDRDQVADLVVLAEVPGRALERLARSQPEDDRYHEGDVEPDHGDGRCSVVADEAPPDRRQR